jgi:demethylmenaquinone methyltransferase/2-methoxy-6-polyprenyl-1,4-benzoquinol methylase
VAKDKVKRAGIRNIKLHQMDATQLKFKSNSFDKVLLSLILHELDEELADKIIMEAKRVLKDNGKIIITEWEPSQQLSKKILFAPLHYLEPKSYRRFIKKDLYSYFESHGLKIQQYEHCDYTKVLVLKKE